MSWDGKEKFTIREDCFSMSFSLLEANSVSLHLLVTLSSVPRATASWVTLVPFDLEQVLELVTFVNERRCDGGERGTEHRYLAQYPLSSWWLLNDDPYSNVVEVGAECQEHRSLLEWGRIGREGKKKDRRKRFPVKKF